MIVSQTKTDLDEVECSLRKASQGTEDVIRALRIKKARKRGYFDAAKLYFAQSVKRSGKSKNLLNNIYRFLFKNT